MSETEDGEAAGNLTAVQSISAKLLEVTRLAEKLDARLCEAGARSQALNPAMEDDETQAPEEDAGAEAVKDADKLEEPIKEADDQSQTVSEHSTADPAPQEPIVEEYVTAIKSSSTPVPRSCTESLLESTEYDDAPVPTTCQKAEDEPSKKNEIVPVTNGEITVATNPTDQAVIELKPDKATVIHRTIQESGGKVVKEVTETTTLRVSQDTHFGVASYKLVSNTLTDHTEHLDYRELQDLERSLLNGHSAPGLETHSEELTKATPNGLVGYHRSDGWSDGLCALENGHDDGLTEEEREFLEMMRTVSVIPRPTT